MADLQFPRQFRSLGAVICAGLATCGVLAGCSGASSPSAVEQVSGGPAGSYVVPSGIHKIKHVIIVMQENRPITCTWSPAGRPSARAPRR